MAQRVGRHTGVFECPTPGWRVTLDQVRDAPEGWTHAFVSLRSPSPVFVYSQVITHQEVSLGIDVSRPTRLYARALDHDGRGPGAYVRAAESTNPVPTPAPK